MTKLTVFYDGTCPLCAKEMKALKQRDSKQQIKTVDIYSEAFADYPQIDPEQANTILHALNDKGELLLGLDVTHRAWRLVVCTIALAHYQTCCGLALPQICQKPLPRLLLANGHFSLQ